MRKVTAIRNSFMIGALLISGVYTAHAQTAEEIIKKAGAAYSSMKTYQAVYLTNMALGQMGSMSMTMDIKAIPGKKMAMKTKANGKSSGQLAAGANAASQEIVDDGTNIYIYMPFRNQYMKQPHAGGSSGVSGSLAMLSGSASLPTDILKTQKNIKYKLLPPATVNGKPAYAIEMSDTRLKTVGASSAVIYIDKATFHLKEMKINISAQGQGMNMSMTVKNEVLNEPIPASTFVFTIPKGATEMKNPAGLRPTHRAPANQ